MEYTLGLMNQRPSQGLGRQSRLAAARSLQATRMLAAMKISLDQFNQRFSPFQFRQVRILEFPAPARFAQSFANTVPFAESIGFTQDYDEARSAETLDQVSYIVAHELGHHRPVRAHHRL
jgi:hypothetical protein